MARIDKKSEPAIFKCINYKLFRTILQSHTSIGQDRLSLNNAENIWHCIQLALSLQVETIKCRFYGRKTINARHPGGREQGCLKHTRY